jgi:hypothetical protein
VRELTQISAGALGGRTSVDCAEIIDELSGALGADNRRVGREATVEAERNTFPHEFRRQTADLSR